MNAGMVAARAAVTLAPAEQDGALLLAEADSTRSAPREG